MKYSKLHTKTNVIGRQYDSVNATLLIKAGFIDQVMAGVYSFLPLGTRVLTKIEQIVREEMDKIGTEVALSALAPREAWEITGRAGQVDVLYGVKAANPLSQMKNDADYILNPTHEELITPIAKKFNRSYKDLPTAYYQIQTKFRNEARPKSGLLRGREFRMKDLYSFHRDEADLKRYYELVKTAYWQVYERLGLKEDTYVVLASGGDFTQDYSHEFQVKLDTGEDTLFRVPSTGVVYNREVAPALAINHEQESELKPMEAVYGENITGMEALVKFLNLPDYRCIKTLIYQTDDDKLIAAAVRGDYEVNQTKLIKVLGCKWVKLAEAKLLEKATGAARGYTGVVGLSDQIKLVADDSTENLVNFECGANRTNYHNVNVNWGRDVDKPDGFADIKMAKAGDLNPEAKEVYEIFKGSEVGNIFPLNTKFSAAIGYTFTDEAGKDQPVYMGSYGIGTTRIMGVLVEKFHDEKGIIWPKSVAPYQVHLVGLNIQDPSTKNYTEAAYNALSKAGVEVLWDDREESPGKKFADADLIGIPVRLVISAKTGDQVEWKERSKSETELVSVEEIISRFRI